MSHCIERVFEPQWSKRGFRASPVVEQRTSSRPGPRPTRWSSSERQRAPSRPPRRTRVFHPIARRTTIRGPPSAFRGFEARARRPSHLNHRCAVRLLRLLARDNRPAAGRARPSGVSRLGPGGPHTSTTGGPYAFSACWRATTARPQAALGLPGFRGSGLAALTPQPPGGSGPGGRPGPQLAVPALAACRPASTARPQASVGLPGFRGSGLAALTPQPPERPAPAALTHTRRRWG